MGKNSVELIGHYGSDEVIACSAWTSTSRTLTDEKRNRIPKLIKDLWDADHHTPMEKGMVHFLINSDIASHIHLLKHRISSANSESARYKELKENKLYVPQDWMDKENTTGLYFNDGIFHSDVDKEVLDWNQILESYTNLGNYLYHKSLEELTPILGRKRAKESTRYFKTYNSQIECDIMFNMRSFHNFLNLRNSEHAQLEIQEIAKQMLELVKGIEGNPFKYTIEAWGM